eukprot:TRINITY_DN1278_c1_g1_i3.p1 TRINITY_DN1278_c1_g1~~TRINITY_DN1278_c1_g1_i3.p1  ORF type:complete len:2509 (+),score=795.47 TRINITY_DN1278_c1_g1_i3:1288-8814(+)
MAQRIEPVVARGSSNRRTPSEVLEAVLARPAIGTPCTAFRSSPSDETMKIMVLQNMVDKDAIVRLIEKKNYERAVSILNKVQETRGLFAQAGALDNSVKECELQVRVKVDSRLNDAKQLLDHYFFDPHIRVPPCSIVALKEDVAVMWQHFFVYYHKLVWDSVNVRLRTKQFLEDAIKSEKPNMKVFQKCKDLLEAGCLEVAGPLTEAYNELDERFKASRKLAVAEAKTGEDVKIMIEHLRKCSDTASCLRGGGGSESLCDYTEAARAVEEMLEERLEEAKKRTNQLPNGLDSLENNLEFLVQVVKKGGKLKDLEVNVDSLGKDLSEEAKRIENQFKTVMGTASDDDVNAYLAIGTVLGKQWKREYESMTDSSCAELETHMMNFFNKADITIKCLLHKHKKPLSYDEQLSMSYLWDDKGYRGTSKEKYLANLQELSQHLKHPLPKTANVVEQCIAAHLAALGECCQKVETVLEGAPGEVRRLVKLRKEYIAADPKLSLLQKHGTISDGTAVHETAAAETALRDELNTKSHTLGEEEAELRGLLKEVEAKLKNRDRLLRLHDWTCEDEAESHVEDLERKAGVMEAGWKNLMLCQQQCTAAKDKKRKKKLEEVDFPNLCALQRAVQNKYEDWQTCVENLKQSTQARSELEKITAIPERAQPAESLEKAKESLNNKVMGLQQQIEEIKKKLELLLQPAAPVKAALQVLQTAHLTAARDLEEELEAKKNQAEAEARGSEETETDTLRQLAPHLRYMETVVNAGVKCKRVEELRDMMVKKVVNTSSKRVDAAAEEVKKIHAIVNGTKNDWAQTLEETFKKVDSVFKYFSTLPPEYEDHVGPPSLLHATLAELYNFMQWSLDKNDETVFARYLHAALLLSRLGSATKQFGDLYTARKADLRNILDYEVPSVVDENVFTNVEEMLELYDNLKEESRMRNVRKTVLRKLLEQLRGCVVSTTLNKESSIGMVTSAHDMWKAGLGQLKLATRALALLEKKEANQLEEECFVVKQQLSAKFKDVLEQLSVSSENSSIWAAGNLNTFSDFEPLMTEEVQVVYATVLQKADGEARITLEKLQEGDPFTWDEMNYSDLMKAAEEKCLTRDMLLKINNNVKVAYDNHLEKGASLEKPRKLSEKLRKIKAFETLVASLDEKVDYASNRRDRESSFARLQAENAVKFGVYVSLSEDGLIELGVLLRDEKIQEKIMSKEGELEAKHVLHVLYCEDFETKAGRSLHEADMLSSRCKQDFNQSFRPNANLDSCFVFWIKCLESRAPRDQVLMARFFEKCNLATTLARLLSTYDEMEKKMSAVLDDDALGKVENVAMEWERSLATPAAKWIKEIRPLLIELQEENVSFLPALKNVDTKIPDWKEWQKKVAARVDKHQKSLVEKGKELTKPTMATQDSVARKEFYSQLAKEIEVLESFTAAGAKALGQDNYSAPDVQGHLTEAFSDLYNSAKQAVVEQDWVLVNQIMGNLGDLQSCPAQRVSEVACIEHAKIAKLLKSTLQTFKDLEGKDKVESLVKLQQVADGVEVLREDAAKGVTAILLKHAKSNGPKMMAELAESLCNHASGAGGHLVREHTVFKEQRDRLFNEKVGKRDINLVLRDIQERNLMTMDTLRSLHAAHDRVIYLFNQYVKESWTSRKGSIEKLTIEAQRLGKDLRLKGGLLESFKQWVTSGTSFDKTSDKLTNLIAHITAIWSLMGSDGSSSEDECLRRPHTVQVIAILCGLGVWTSGKLLNGSFVQVGTGEGKSVVLAVQAAVCGLIGIKPYVVCYSSYLSRRDQADFEKLLERLEANPFYGTFNECCEDVLQGKSLRDEAMELLKNGKSRGKSSSDWRRGTPKRCLLIDEADVFNGSFYGQQYLPSMKLPSKELKGLTDCLWEQRDNEDELQWEKVKELDEYKKLATKFVDYLSLFEEAIRSMIEDLKYYKSGPEWVVDEEKLKEDGTVKIGYVEQDAVNWLKMYEYGTLWAMYEEYRKESYPGDKEAREWKLADALYLQFKLGQYSYTHLAMEEFDFIVGVSGTLPKAGSAEADVIRSFGIEKMFVMPSMYGASNLSFKENADVSAEEKGNPHFKALMDRVKKTLITQKRSALVLFETEKEVDEYMKLVSETEDEAFVRMMQRMVEGHTHEERMSRTRRATTPGVLTFATRVYGRGIDFIVTQKEMLIAGGLDVIQTFMGPISEHLQIMGRAARQGQLGSFSMLLIAEDLERFGIGSKQAIKASKAGTLYQLLLRESEAFYAKNLSLQTEELKRAKDDHDESMAFRKELYGALTKEKLIQKLVKWNRGPRASSTSRTVILLDATLSMSHLIHGAKAVLRETFKRICTIISREAEEGTFSIQICVYRNYNHKLFECSKWCDDAGSLYEFLQHVTACGGWGDEAVEVGLQHVNNEEKVTQVILMGDAPSSSETKLTAVKNLGYEVTTNWEAETRLLAEKNIPVHTFYLAERAKENFEQIAELTGGRCEELDVSAPESTNVLTDLWSMQVLRDIGGDKLEDAYKVEFVKRYATGSHVEAA